MDIIRLDNYDIINIQEGFCTECKSDAEFVEICSEARFCSIECCDKFYKRYDKIFEAYLEEDDLEDGNNDE